MNCEKCSHYYTKTKYERLCYYEPQCWKGFARIVMSIFKKEQKCQN